MMKLLTLLTMTLILSSCYDAKKALDKAQYKDPKAVADFCQQKFPCQTGTIDTIVKTEYQYVEMICDSIDTIMTHDTLILPIQGPSRSYFINNSRFVAVPSQVKVITKTVRDSATIAFLQYSLDECNNLKNEIQMKHEQKKTWLLWLLFLLLGSLFVNVLFITNKR